MPYFNGGEVADFGVRREYGALVTMTVPGGEVLPAGSIVRSVATGKLFPVARRGEVNLTDVDSGSSFVAESCTSTCAFSLPDIKLPGTSIVRIGPIQCEPE